MALGISWQLGDFQRYCEIRDDLSQTCDGEESQKAFKQGADFAWTYQQHKIEKLEKQIKELKDGSREEGTSQE